MPVAAFVSKLLTLGVLAALLGACAGHLDRLKTQTRHDAASIIRLKTKAFDLIAVGRASTAPVPRLRIYLEGDGKAWATRTQPSTDPSPRDLWWARRAMRDTTASVYLARPCQFIRPQGCSMALWTERRFAPEVIDSLQAALDQLKARYGARRLELIGYSGGGHLALVLAGERGDVEQVQTVAGNLDPVAWVQHHQVSPLVGVTDPARLVRLTHLPQRHFVGLQDTVVPPDLVRQAIARAGYRCASVVPVDASHTDDWAALESTAFEAPLPCAASRVTGN